MLLLLALATRMLAATVEAESLRDLRSLEVGIEALPVLAADVGLTVADLQTDVELRIRNSRIPVKEGSQADGNVLVAVSLLQSKGTGLWAYVVTVQILRAVYLLSSNGFKKSAAITWVKTEMGMGGSTVIGNGIRGSVRDLVDKFLNDYLSVHDQLNGPRAQ